MALCEERELVIRDGVNDLIESRTWRASEDDLGFAIGYVSSYVRQVSGNVVLPHERPHVRDAILTAMRFGAFKAL